MAAKIKVHISSRRDRWENDRRFKVTTTHMSLLAITDEEPDGDPRPFNGLRAHTNTKMDGWCVYDYGKYIWVDTQAEAQQELITRAALMANL